MSRSKVIVGSFAIALMLAPVVAAGWAGKGSAEPDTVWDAEDNFMFTDPPTGPKQVYFNGFITDGDAPVITSTSPNSASLGSAILPRGARPAAMLGVWVDCNGDGYIGNGDANYVYSTLLLGDTSSCPTSAVFPTNNDGRWVYEFHPVTWNNATTVACCDANTYTDNLAKMWADATLPDAVLSRGCDTTTVNPGVTQSTGGYLGWADCHAGYAVTHAIDQFGPEEASFSDQPDGMQHASSSMLNQPVPGGDADDDSYVSVMDCDAELTRAEVANPTGEPTPRQQVTVPGVVIVTIPSAGPGLAWINQSTTPRPMPEVNPDGGFWGTVDLLGRETSDCDMEGGGMGGLDTCHALCERGEKLVFAGRTRPDATLRSANWPHIYGANSNDPAQVAADAADKQNMLIGADFRQYWYSNNAAANTGPVRSDLQPSAARHWTFYAMVSDTARVTHGLALPGATGQYGAEACAASEADGKLRFNCDQSQWWRNADGTERTAVNEGNGMCSSVCDPRAFVGNPYNLRDIDCYDYGTAATRSAGLTASRLLAGEGC